MSNRYLGIELGSTTIKAVTLDSFTLQPVSSGQYLWESSFINNNWTYDMREALEGFKKALSGIEDRESISVAGISGMMHGYLAFDEDWNLLTPFRTWRNTSTREAAEELTELFDFAIPQRWSIAHLYQAILNNEEHVSKVRHITTLSGYFHYLLTGENVLGVCEASGMFPVDVNTLDFDAVMLEKAQRLFGEKGFVQPLKSIMPKVLRAGEYAGALTKSGAELIDGMLKAGTPFAPPEGDAGTGMVATNSVLAGTGNVSAGTSIFAITVLEKSLSRSYSEINIAATPDGLPVAMVQSNNCTGDLNGWVRVIKEAVQLAGAQIDDNELYTRLFTLSLEGESDCDGLINCNYLAGEGVTHFNSGRPLLTRMPDTAFTLANLMRSQLFSLMATLRIGMDIIKGENVDIRRLTAHGGLFKTKGVCQKYLAGALNTAVTCMDTASLGGPYGMALLAAYTAERAGYVSLGEFLEKRVFEGVKSSTVEPDKETVEGFDRYLDSYKRLLQLERLATEII